MPEEKSFLKRHALVIGIVLMFLCTWPIDLSNSGLLPFNVPFILSLFVGWGFIVAALLMTWLTLGRTAVGPILRSCLMWRVNCKWYLALLIILAAQVLGVFLNAAFTGTPADFSKVIADQLRPPGFSRLAFVIPFFLIDIVANGEEIGWRGYVLPSFQAKYTALAASLITFDSDHSGSGLGGHCCVRDPQAGSETFTWTNIKDRVWLQIPTDPKTGVPSKWLYLWTNPLLLVLWLGPQVLGPLDALWVKAFPFLTPPLYALNENLAEPAVGLYHFL